MDKQEDGESVITGDEGNGWCIPLTIGNSIEEVLREYIKHPEKTKPRFANLLEALIYIDSKS
jgi:hypothetical protein